MPIFEYEGINAKGENISGHVHGEALDIASRSLAGQGITVNKIGKVAGAVEESRLEPPGVPVPPPTEERSKFETRVVGQVIQVVPLQALQFFFSQLGTLLDAGINPADGLETLTKQTNSHKLIAIIRECKDHVIAGRPISVGLQRYPEVFSPLMLSMVRVGEEGGFLAEQCETLSEYIRREIELRNTIKRETATPKLTLAASVVIILGTNGLIQVVAPGGGQLPVPWFIWILAIIVGAGAFLFNKFGVSQPAVKHKFDEFVQLLPGIGPMIHGFAMAKFGRAFGALYKGGVALPRAVQLSADACGNEAVRARIWPAVKALEDGAGITETFASTNAFSPLVLDMTRTGETSGNMDKMLDKVSQYYEEEGAMKAEMTAKIIGVLSLLFVGAYVGFILVTFYSGYFGRLTGG